MYYSAGDPIRSKDTEKTRRCRIPPQTRGWVTYVEGGSISFYLDVAYGLDARCPAELFAWNFEPDRGRMSNSAYEAKEHATKRFPDDLF